MIGYAAALTLACFTTAKDLVSKRLSSSLTGTVSAFASFLYAVPYYLIALPLLWLLGFEDFSVTQSFFALILLRALIDTAAEWSKMESFSHADISLVSAFQSLSPAFLVLLSPIVTGDPIKGSEVVGLLIITIAGLLMIRPGGGITRDNYLGVLLGIACAFFFALNHSVDRLAAQTASAPLSAFSMTILSCCFIFPFTLKGRPYSQILRAESRPLFVRGLFEVLGMTAKLFALQHLTAPQVVAVSRLSVPFAITLGGLVFKEKQIPRRLLLGTLIVLGSFLTIFEW